MLNLVIKFFNFLLCLPAIWILYYFWQPVSSWYLGKIPALGVDLYLSATNASYHLRNFSLPFNSFKDIWFGGYPFMRDFPQLAYFLMMPFVAREGSVIGVQKFTMIALLLITISCYFLYFKLSKNHGLAIVLATLVLYSANIYGAATWAGSIPYFLSQAIFPLGLLVGAFYLERSTLRELSAMILVTGVGFLVHPLGILSFLIPSLFIIIVIGGIKNRLKPLAVLSHFLIYNAGWLLAAFTVTYDYILTFFTQRVIPAAVSISGGSGESQLNEGTRQIAQFYKNQISLLGSATDPWLFKLVFASSILAVFGFVIAARRRNIFKVLPFLLIAGYCALHAYVNLSSIVNIFRHDPYRAFWPFPIAVGAVSAVCVGFFLESIYARLKRKSILALFAFVANLTISLTFVFLAFSLYKQHQNSLLERLESAYEASSAFPEALGLKTSRVDQEQLARDLLPSFIDPAEKNKRLYSADATVNIWWNTFFPTPLARGYIDPPVGVQSRGGFFWLDIAIANDSIVRDFGVSEDVAFNNALFLIDWYGIGYFEGGRGSSRGPNPAPSSYLLNDKVIEKEEDRFTYGVVLRWLTASGKPEVNLEVPQNLHFYKFKDDVTSPILYPSDASVILIFSIDPGYEDIMRILASQNINSRHLIPLNSKGKIDDFSLNDLKNFDAVFLHQYQYNSQDKAFSLLDKYVKDGGKLFIDTGAEVRESNGDNLPEIFPFKSSERKGQGRLWELKSVESDVTREIDVSDFGPAVFNESEWKITTPRGDDLRDGSKVLLTHKGKPVLIERQYGRGKIVWSGLNLAYHYNQYKKEAESKLFINILKSFVNISDNEPLTFQARWEKPEKVILETNEKPRGILFKEQGYDGWSAHLLRQAGSGGQAKSLPIYLTGPTFPGFMYVPVKSEASGPIKVDFAYNGTLLYWFVAIVNLIVIVILVDQLLLNGKIFGKFLRLVYRLIHRRVSSWWVKEEE